MKARKRHDTSEARRKPVNESKKQDGITKGRDQTNTS
jgi:hypothetical protein